MAEEFWGKIELMGHVTHAGRISEEEKFGGKLGRVDVPRPDGTFATVYFGAASVYRISILTEEVAQQLGMKTAAPVSPWELPRPTPSLPPPTLSDGAPDDYIDPDPDPDEDEDATGYD